MNRKRWSGAVVSAVVLSLTASLVASKDTSELSLFSMRSHFDSLVFKSPRKYCGVGWLSTVYGYSE